MIRFFEPTIGTTILGACSSEVKLLLLTPSGTIIGLGKFFYQKYACKIQRLTFFLEFISIKDSYIHASKFDVLVKNYMEQYA